MRSEGNIYNPVPERKPATSSGEELAQLQYNAIERACDIRLHRSFMLPPNVSIGRNRSIRVTYADVGFVSESMPSSPDAAAGDEEVSTVLWCRGQFGGRYSALAMDGLARKYRVRVLIMDRPGIGGTEDVSLSQRVATWLDMVPALLQHVGIQHVHLASHSAGTIYLLNTLLHQAHLLHPRRPYAACFGAWVHPTQSSRLTMSMAQLLPDYSIHNWAQWTRFRHQVLAPAMTTSGMKITKTSVPRTRQPDAGTLGSQTQKLAGGDEKLNRAIESLLTEYIYAENIDGGIHESMLCLKRGVEWGHHFASIDDAVVRIAQGEKQRQAQLTNSDFPFERLRIQMYFAERDEAIGRGGQRYLEECFRADDAREYLDFRAEVVPDTDHNEVVAVTRGAIEKMLRAVGSVPGERRAGEVEN